MQTFTGPLNTNTALIFLRRCFPPPILMPFNHTRTTVVETDSSGYNTGGALSQYDDKGFLHSCAYFSKWNAPGEYNYEISQKEVLAIVQCPEVWDAELRSVDGFQFTCSTWPTNRDHNGNLREEGFRKVTLSTNIKDRRRKFQSPGSAA